MIRHGISYLVTKREGMRNIFRGGSLAGQFAESGYNVEIFGKCSALAGTEAAAHAIAEFRLVGCGQNRHYVLTEAEYDRHIEILRADHAAIMERFPFSDTEAAEVARTEEKYAAIIAAGERRIKDGLMNNWERYSFSIR